VNVLPEIKGNELSAQGGPASGWEIRPDDLKIDTFKFLRLKCYSAKHILYILKKYILSDNFSNYHIKDPDKLFFNDANKLYIQNNI
jgi:hypothetical protein